MKVATSLEDADVSHPSVVSIGNFDGVHLGHRKILKTVVEKSRQLGVQAVAMTFSPHPVQFLAPDRAPRRISTPEQKIQLVSSTGIDLLFIARFDHEFSRMSPEHFVREFLIEGLKARAVCVGGNFNFGYRQRGTVQTLREFEEFFEVIEVPPVRVRGTVVSSSRVRELVEAGEISAAGRLLGRWLEIDGTIVSGAGRGRALLVPTLNLSADNELIPKAGVYVTQIALDNGRFSSAITNVGFRPTFEEHGLTIETFILDPPVPEEAKKARLRFLCRLRDERKFGSAEELRNQIITDVGRARKFFRLVTPQ
jgi:riboflavin kinase/FMN adenylyltransferase